MKEISKQVSMKQEVKLALEVFTSKYQRVPKGIQSIYEDMMLSNDIKEITKAYTRFFGYLKKSKRAKDKFDYLEE